MCAALVGAAERRREWLEIFSCEDNFAFCLLTESAHGDVDMPFHSSWYLREKTALSPSFFPLFLFLSIAASLSETLAL